MTCGDTLTTWIPDITGATFNIATDNTYTTVIATAVFARVDLLNVNTVETTYTNPASIQNGTWDPQDIDDLWTLRWNAGTLHYLMRLTASICDTNGRVTDATGKMFTQGFTASTRIYGQRIL